MEPSTELQAIIKNWFESVVMGDASWLDRHLSKHSQLRIVGTDPHEFVQGEQAVALLRSDLAALGGNAMVDVRDVEAFSEDNVGWGVARPEVTIGGEMKVSPRWSAVFHREDGEWRAVQIHASIGMSNEAAFGADAAAKAAEAMSPTG
jgi:hypothetical protein